MVSPSRARRTLGSQTCERCEPDAACFGRLPRAGATASTWRGGRGWDDTKTRICPAGSFYGSLYPAESASFTDNRLHSCTELPSAACLASTKPRLASRHHRLPWMGYISGRASSGRSRTTRLRRARWSLWLVATGAVNTSRSARSAESGRFSSPPTPSQLLSALPPVQCLGSLGHPAWRLHAPQRAPRRSERTGDIPERLGRADTCWLFNCCALPTTKPAVASKCSADIAISVTIIYGCFRSFRTFRRWPGSAGGLGGILGGGWGP